MKNQKIWIKGFIQKANKDDYTIEGIASTPTKDRHLDTVNPKGWDLKNFKKNPVLLWAHDYSTPPVGKVTNIKLVGDNLQFKAKFADTNFARDMFRLFKDGFLNAFSVGFIAKEFGDMAKEEYTYMKQELLEISCVPVPANAEALILNSLNLHEETETILAKTLKSEDNTNYAKAEVSKEAETVLEDSSADSDGNNEDDATVTENGDNGESDNNTETDNENESEDVSNKEETENDSAESEGGQTTETEEVESVEQPQGEETVENVAISDILKAINDINAKLDALQSDQVAKQAQEVKESEKEASTQFVTIKRETLNELKKSLQLNDKTNESALRKIKILISK